MSGSRVLIVGPAEAGKSTLVRLLCDRALNLAHNGRTVAMDHAVLDNTGRRAVLIGVPGQERFRSVREVLAAQGNAVLWVHPQGRSPDPETISLLHGAAEGLPYSVFVNQRRGESAVTSFPALAELAPAREVIVGDLLGDPTTVERVRRAIWSLAGS